MTPTPPATVQRYDIGAGPNTGGMVAHGAGDWVRWEDRCRALEAAEKEVAKLRAKVDSLKLQLATMTEAWQQRGLACETFQQASDVALADAARAEAERDAAVGLLAKLRPHFTGEKAKRIDALLGKATT